MKRLIFAALFLAAGACKKAPEEPSVPKQSVPVWSVYKGDREVIRIKGEPGFIVSAAEPLPGGIPPRHPFLTLSSFDAMEEDPIQTILEKSTSFDDFVDRLKKAGYAVKPGKGPL